MIAVYLIMILAAIAGVCAVGYWMVRRQQTLTAEMTRVERLAAEVSMTAEAILERVDERLHYLQEMSAAIEAKAEASISAAAPTPVPAPAPAPATAPVPVASVQRYREMRAAVWELAAQGLDKARIAENLALSSGEVELMLNLRGRKPISSGTQA